MWCLYMLQDVLYPSGMINQMLQLIMLLWGLIALYKYATNTNIHSPFLKATFLLVSMYVLYGGVHIIWGKGVVKEYDVVPTYYYLRSALNSLVPIFLFYYFSHKKYLTSDRIRIYLPIFIFVCILIYYKNKVYVMQDTGREEIANNMAYMFTSLIPMLFFFDKKAIWQYFQLVIIMLFVFMGMKRGAMLVGGACTIILLYANFKNAKGKESFFIVFLSIALIVGLVYYIESLMNNSAFFVHRIEQTLEGHTSNRDIIYGRIWQTVIKEHNVFYLLFGRGANSTITVAGNYAHQDWLEILCNNGIVGVLILLFFFHTLGKMTRNSRKRFPLMMYYSFVTLFFTSFIKTMFSMSIQNLDLTQTLLLGYFAYWSNCSSSLINNRI